HPTGAGQTRELPNPEHLNIDAVQWLDNHRVVMFGQKQGQLSRGYVQDIDGGAPRPFTPERVGVRLLRWWSMPVSPDGTRVVARDPQEVPTIYRVSDGQQRPIPGLQAEDVPVQGTEDGNALFMAHGKGWPWVIERAAVVTGPRTPVMEIRAREEVGLRFSIVALSRNGRYYVHSFSRL